jgi:hypothetical protein
VSAGADRYLGVKPGENALGAAVGGYTDIEEWRVGRCQAATVRLLLDRAPDLRLPSGFVGQLDLWKARSGNCSEVLRLVEGRRGAHPANSTRAPERQPAIASSRPTEVR